MITILDLVRAHCGDQDSYSGADHEAAGYAIMGGCAGCGATLASYNAHPTRSDYWGCADCVPGHMGYATVAEYQADQSSQSDDMDPLAELLAAVESVAGDLSETDIDRLRYWARRVSELMYVCGNCDHVGSIRD